MRLVTFARSGSVGAGVLEGEEIRVFADGPGADRAVLDVVMASGALPEPSSGQCTIALADVRLLAPIPSPRSAIYCVGKNYHAHAAEFHGSGFDSTSKEVVPQHPVIFTKPPGSVVGPGEPVKGSLDPTGTVDYEGELGVVIGKTAFQVARADAYDHVFGYVAMNDVTSRELQRKHGQWTIGKGLDTFCPMGPFLVTADEVGDVAQLELVTEINGEVRQKASVADLVFDIPTLIETMSATMTLHPGDIIATGTPAGVGIGFDPPKYLAKGDVMRVSITGLGVLENTIE